MLRVVRRDRPWQEQDRFRDIRERLLRSTDPEEQDQLKTELVRVILAGSPSRQQNDLRELTAK